MKSFKKVLSLALCLIMLLGTVAVGGEGFAEFLDAISIKASATYAVGDTIYYGSYPQTDVTSSLGSTLNSQSGTWKSYGYYSGSGSWTDGQMTSSNYMRYKDVSYNGNKYRAVTFDNYRPNCTGTTSEHSEQDDNGYTTGNVYWFKFESIKWRVLDPTTGLVLCDSVIDSQAYNNYVIKNGTDSHGNDAYWGDSAQTYYANNYAKSSIRQWLNNDFYNTAFTSAQKTIIKTTTLNNDSRLSLTGSTGYKEFDAPSTNDKVFLLSYDQVINSGYGFDSTESNYDNARRLQGSDYAKCQGLVVYNGNTSEYKGNSRWWMRSPGWDSESACEVNYGGEANYSHSVYSINVGVVPALQLSNLTSDTSGEGEAIYYGTYPQSKVTDSAIISSLNSLGGTWVSYNYYSGTGDAFDGQMTSSDYMCYKDVTYYGNKYRAVIFDSYRPYATGYTSSTDNTYQDDNGYTTGNVYWFKYEPIKWRVLDFSTGLVMCDSAIDSQAYSNYVIKNGTDGLGKAAKWGDSAQTYYANNYAKSSIRQWLNNDFYNTAFTSSQKSNIKTTTLNNDTRYTLTGITGYEEYDAPSTEDKVFLLSYDQIINSGYGFDSTESNYDTARGLKGSDYAKCQGLWVYNSSSSVYNGNSWWWLRSPGNGSGSACSVSYIGTAYYNYSVLNTFKGIVPALQLSNLKSDTSQSEIYKVSYNANGGTNAPEWQTKYYGKDLTLSEDVQSRTGYTFTGWNTRVDGLGTSYAPGATYTANADVTLYAQWNPDTFRVIYNANGGTNAPAEQTKVYDIDLTLTTDVPTRAGYDFLGWADESDAAVATYYSGSVYSQNSAIVLYAVWQEGEYSITLDANGGKFRDGSSSKVMKYDRGDEIYPQNFDIPVRDGYKFMGWADSATSTDNIYGTSDSVIVTGNKTYYAVWKNTFTITLKGNMGRFADGSSEKILNYRFGDEVYPEYFEQPSREGYTFMGWTAEATSETYFGAGYKTIVDEDKVYYAVWQKNYDLTYDANGGTCAPVAQTGSYHYTISQTVPIREGHNFLGWAKTSTASVAKYQPGDEITLSEDTTLYGVWQIITYKVTYDANGGSNAPDNQVKTWGVDLQLSNTMPTYATYTFLGWATDKDATTPEYFAGSTYIDNADLTLYALWEENYYTITIDANGGLFKAGASTQTHSFREGNPCYPENFEIPTRDGYNFLGWSETKTVNSSFFGLGDFLMIISDITLYATWEKQSDEYTIVYDANGGEGAPEAQIKTKDVDLVLSSTVPTRMGYTFEGWAESKLATEAVYTAGATYTANKSATLYAVWNADEYTLTFDAGEGKFANGESKIAVKYKFGEPISEISGKPTRTGYSFNGWTEVPATMPATDVTVYAEWNVESDFNQSNRYSFDNSDANFSTEWTNGSYYMTEADQEKLFNYIKKYDTNAESTISEVEEWFSEEWGGSCYGMASTAVLDYQNKVAFNENFGTDAETMWDIESPSTNPDLMSAINYYMVSQSISFIREGSVIYLNFNENWNVGLKELVKEAKKGEPFLFSFYMIIGGHAIVALDCTTDENGDYYIRAYDNNFPDEDVYIYVSSDFETCYVDAYYDFYNQFGYGEYAEAYGIEFYKDMSAFDMIDIDGENNDMSITYSDYRYNNKNAFISMVADGNVTVTNKAGQKITYNNGVFSGNMNIINTYFIIRNDIDATLGKVEFIFEVAPSKSFTFESSADNMDVSVKSGSMYAAATAENADYIVVGENEGVYVVGDDMEYSATLSSKDSAYDTVTISGNADKDVSITYSGSNILVSGFDTSTDKLTVYSGSITGEEYNLDSGYSDLKVTSENNNVDIMGSSANNGNFDTSIVHKHSYKEVTIRKALCFQEGIKTYTCDCGDSYTVILEKTEHTFTYVYNEDATLEADGTETQKCTVCGATGETRTKPGSKLVPDHTHSYKSDVTKQPTCEEDGIMTYTCACGDSYTKLIAKTAHTAANEQGKCDTCGTVIDAAKNNLYTAKQATINVPSSRTIGWKFKAKMTATAILPAGYHIAWFEGNSKVSDDASYTSGNLTSVHTYTAKTVDKSGVTISTDSQNKSVTVSVKTGFFDKLISFFQRLFGGDVTTL